MQYRIIEIKVEEKTFFLPEIEVYVEREFRKWYWLPTYTTTIKLLEWKKLLIFDVQLTIIEEGRFDVLNDPEHLVIFNTLLEAETWLRSFKKVNEDRISKKEDEIYKLTAALSSDNGLNIKIHIID